MFWVLGFLVFILDFWSFLVGRSGLEGFFWALLKVLEWVIWEVWFGFLWALLKSGLVS